MKTSQYTGPHQIQVQVGHNFQERLIEEKNYILYELYYNVLVLYCTSSIYILNHIISAKRTMVILMYSRHKMKIKTQQQRIK